ncbi:hypothetical protein IFM89_022991 [Coptis chinensis]|uniref:Uncharacterized protein n=1 Tax=Coptis chinensis TaxID=261450 RepID=A0A835M1D1_9MAGN|nr:hypothetical protein IFM89_022991 [Coptis chinensis]
MNWRLTFVFFILNFVVLLGNYRPPEVETENWFASPPKAVQEVEEIMDVQKTNNEDEYYDDYYAYEGYDTDDEDDDEDAYAYDSSESDNTIISEDEEGGDDFQKRCEEFITKTNNEWRAECLREQLRHMNMVQR